MNVIMKTILLAVITAALLLAIVVDMASAQEEPDPRNAFLRSMVLPGWGHHYVDRNDWGRGQAHLAAEAIFIASYVGLSVRTGYLEDHFTTLSNLRAGVDIRNKDRSFILAMGEFNSLEEYNDHQLRTRNWNRLIEDVPENRWQWDSENDRRDFSELRSNRDRLRNQLPALAGLMVVNRVISGISAYNRARNRTQVPEVTLLPIPGEMRGVTANISFRF